MSYHEKNSVDTGFREQISKIKKKINSWKRRNLTLIGKNLIMKTFALSQILFLSSVHIIPEWAIKEIKDLMFAFLWNGKHHKVKDDVIVQSIEHGGYNMIDLSAMIIAQRVRWVKRYLSKDICMWKKKNILLILSQFSRSPQSNLSLTLRSLVYAKTGER